MRTARAIFLIFLSFTFVPLSRSQSLTITTLAGYAGLGSANGTGANARFANPWGVATDTAGNLYVADTDNHTIRKITPGGVVTTLAGMGESAEARMARTAARGFSSLRYSSGQSGEFVCR